MTAQFQILLLGGLSVRQVPPVQQMEFVSRKAEVLLAFLACNPQPHSREHLATLLWDNRPLERAMGNLRVVLTNLRKLMDTHLAISRNTVAFQNSANIWLDCQLFEESLNAADRCFLSEGIRSVQGIEILKDAVALYRGDFLQGVHLRNSLGFEEWAMLERERLSRRLTSALETLANYYMGERDYQRGIETAARLLALEPYNEAHHQLMMRLLARSGKKNRALAHFQQCRTLLNLELGVNPSAETQRLYQHIRDGAPQNPELPAQFNEFVGRSMEMRTISARLQDPNCRLLTLLGPGGVGKSRLAIEYAHVAAKEQWDLYPDGVHFIAMSQIGHQQAMVPAVAAALGLDLPGSASPLEGLLAMLHNKQMLLVLDNLEHLLEASTLLVRRLLNGARGIHILATSQARLRLRAEWLLELKGLLCAETCNDDALAADWSCSAAQLFRQTAGRLRSDFSLASELPHVCHICRLVEGLPLGIELAASFVRESPCAQIALEVQENLDFISTSIPDLPARHRSLRAVFEHAWKLMSQEDQLIYQRLAVFHDSFTLKAAEQITKATTNQIIRLRERSLLQQVAEGRYELHNILRHFAAEKLGPGFHSFEFDRDRPVCTEETAAGRRWFDLAAEYSRYYLNYLSERRVQLRGSGQKAAAAELAIELDNIRTAWNWAVGQNQRAELAEAADPLCRFLIICNCYEEGAALMKDACQRLSVASNGESPDELQGRLMIHHGLFLQLMGKYRESLDLLRAGLKQLKANSPAHLNMAQIFLGATLWRMNNSDEAKAIYRNVLASIEPEEDVANVLLAYDGPGAILYLHKVFDAYENYLT